MFFPYFLNQKPDIHISPPWLYQNQSHTIVFYFPRHANLTKQKPPNFIFLHSSLAADFHHKTPPSLWFLIIKIIPITFPWSPLKKMVIWIEDLKVFLMFLDVLLKFYWSLPQDYFRAISTALKLYLKSRREGPSLWWCLLSRFYPNPRRFHWYFSLLVS